MSHNPSRAKPIIKARGLHKYFGTLHVVRGVDLDVMPGEVVVIIGPSGAGKSTFLRCLNFLEEPSAGTIEIDGVEIKAGAPVAQRRRRIREIRQKASMVFPQLDVYHPLGETYSPVSGTQFVLDRPAQQFNLFPHMTVLSNLIEGAVTVKGMPREQAIAQAEEVLAWMGLSDKRDEYPSRLAGGQQQQVAIARSLCMEPKIMLFDNPTSALDPDFVGQMVDVMQRLARASMTMLVVTDELHFARHVADRVILMADGVWVEMASAEELFTNPKQERTRQFLAHLR
jgi:ABC-type polar amino acid transport system ATPase subunit